MSELDKIQTNPISRSSNVDHTPGERRKISREERHGVSSTDLEPVPALGVGESTSRRAEDIARRAAEPGRWYQGRKGRSRRPAGTSTPRDASAVDPQEPISADTPHLPPGDQGG
jgi:hypothetical protein